MKAIEAEHEPRHSDVKYERRDLSHAAVFAFLAFLICGAILVHIGIWGAFSQADHYVGHQTANPIMTSTEELKDVGGDPSLAFPMPHLQPDPVADLNKFRLAEEERLNSYGWVDKNAGKIHIPIEKAIEITASTWNNAPSKPAAANANSKAPSTKPPSRTPQEQP